MATSAPAATSPPPVSTASRAATSRPRAGVTSRLVIPCALECSAPATITPAVTNPICTASVHMGAMSSKPNDCPLSLF